MLLLVNYENVSLHVYSHSIPEGVVSLWELKVGSTHVMDVKLITVSRALWELKLEKYMEMKC